MRSAALALFVGLSACPSAPVGSVESPVPTVDVVDYRLSFSTVTPDAGCTGTLADEVNAAEPFSLVQRVHFPDGVDEPAIDVFRRSEADGDDAFAFIASGTLKGNLAQGILRWSGAFGTGTGHSLEACTLDSLGSTRFSDEIVGGQEDLMIDVGKGCADPACRARWEFEGTLLQD